MEKEHVFSKEYVEKRNARLRALSRIGDEEKRPVKMPVRAVLVAAVLVAALATGLMATGVLPAPKYIFHTDSLPDGVDKIVGVEERFEEYPGLTAPSLEYYIQKLDGEEFYKVTDIPEEDLVTYNLEYEVFEVNGHYAQILHYKNWTPPEDMEVEEYTNKQMIVYFEEEDLIVQIWGSNLMTFEDLKKTAEGLWFEVTEDVDLAVKVYD